MAFLDEPEAYGDRVTVSPQDETSLLDLPSILGTPRPDTLVYCCVPEPLLAAKIFTYAFNSDLIPLLQDVNKTNIGELTQCISEGIR
jgi:hypothetical protein